MVNRSLLALALVVGVGVAPANAAIIFSDNFNSENGGVGALNYNSFANFSVSDGTVDLIGNGFFEFPPETDGHGLYVDLDGSTLNAGLMLSNPLPLIAGNYTLFFQLAGNQRDNTADVVNIRVFLDAVQIFFGAILKPPTEPFLFYAIPLVIPGGNLSFSFENLGGDNIGALLDNVRLEGPEQVPEPATLLLLGSAVLAGGIRAHRRARRHVER